MHRDSATSIVSSAFILLKLTLLGGSGGFLATVRWCSCCIPICARLSSSLAPSGQPVQTCFDTGISVIVAVSSLMFSTVVVAVGKIIANYDLPCNGY